MILHKHKQTIGLVRDYLLDALALIVIFASFYVGLIGACLLDDSCSKSFLNPYHYEVNNE